MPAPTHPLPPNLSALHLYRHILREITYLPPVIRPTIFSQVYSRFFNSRGKRQNVLSRKKNAYKALRRLRAANSGDRKMMDDLILRAFGRKGWRRRQLFTQFVQQQGPANAQDLETLMQKTEAAAASPDGKLSKKEKKQQSKSDASTAPVAHPTLRKANKFLTSWDLPKMTDLLKSQREHRNHTKTQISWPGAEVKTLQDMIQVPDKNVWGKPVAPARVESIRAKWWKRQATKTQPPLTKAEWDMLSELGTREKHDRDELSWLPPTERRVHAGSPQWIESHDNLEQELEAHGSLPAGQAEQSRLPGHTRRTGVAPAGPYSLNPGLHPCPPRFFRRAFGKAWMLAPKWEQNPNTLQHRVEWGQSRTRVPAPSRLQMAVFDNVPTPAKRKGQSVAQRDL